VICESCCYQVKVAADPVINGRRVILEFADDRKNNNSRSLLCCHMYPKVMLLQKIIIVNLCVDELTRNLNQRFCKPQNVSACR